MSFNNSTTRAVIFGGTGFIGSSFAAFLLSKDYVDEAFLVDIEPFNSKPIEFRKMQASNMKNYFFITS